MSADANSAELVALVFAKTSLDLQHWDNLFAELTSKLQTRFSDLDGPATPTRRFLEASRVAEIRLSSTTSPPLQDCKAFTDSDEIQSLQTQHDVEIILQPGTLYVSHRTPGLAVFDMDSTLIQQEVIDELARAVGLYDQVAAITAAAMRGEEPYTDFEASLRARVALLKGVPMSIWDKMKADIITFTPGAPELIRALKKLGWKAAVLSGGFTPLANWVKDTLGLDYAYANHLVSDLALEQLTGELVQEAPIIHGQKKRELLLELASQNSLATQNVIAVGDGSNDLPMMHEAGLGVAFHAKPKVQLAAPAKLNTTSLLDVLYILGYTKDEIDAAIA